jgi:hypothetical protein
MITFRRLGRFGRFGNQLFQYAGARLYAQTHGYAWGFPAWDGEQFFDIPRRRAPLRTLLTPTIQLADVAATSWSERLLSPVRLWQRGAVADLYAHPRDNLNLYGYLQDDFSIEKLREHKTTVREWFRFRPEIDSALREATDAYRPWLSVHIRRGDMVKRNSATNTDDALSGARRLQGTRNLFIATDDSKLRAHLAYESVITPPNPLPELPLFIFDFWMLKESEILVGSGSTFAWWAAFLGGMEYWSPPLNNTWRTESAQALEHLNL